MSKPAADTSSDIRDRIIDIAEERFRHFGYRKTNVGEIAADAGMSAGNLYRYFENKEDIAAACAVRCMGRLDLELQAVLQEPGLQASVRLERYVLLKLRLLHDQAHNHPRISEIVETVVGERPEVIHWKIETTRKHFASIIEEGIRQGEFAQADANLAADSLMMALVFFGTPTFMPLYSLEAMEEMARGVVRLLINGLAVR